MKKILKRGLSLVLAIIMVVGLMPVTAFAKVDNNTGYPQDLDNKLILSIYTKEGTFPGEPATHGTAEYVSFKSDFTRASTASQFKASAEDELSPSILEKDVLLEGTGNSSTKVWGVFSADGLNQYFLEDASIIQPANEKKIIQDIKGCSEVEAEKYEIIWYVIKMQHSPSSWWWNSGTSEWHIDGVIKEKAKASVNYYGNGNTSGQAPDGVTDHDPTKPYTVLGKNTLKKVMNGVEVAFLGWSARADGSGAELAFYQPGDKISAEDLQEKYNGKLSLYAMWDTTTQYTATVNTYLDGKLTSDSTIHATNRELALGTTDGSTTHYYDLPESSTGVYTTKITGNGKFHLYNKNADGTYTQVGDRQLTIYNQDGTMDIHHYSVTYDANGGSFETDPGKQIYYYGDTVTAVADVPTRDGYIFLGWKAAQEDLIQPGAEVTASITAPIKLTAQWEQTINVTINVTINHKGGNGLDKMETKDDVSLALVSRENSGKPYLEVEGKTLELSGSARSGLNIIQTEDQTKYTGYTFEKMPGGDVEYTVVTSKSGYETEITPTKGDDGNWVIDVEMTYEPSNFDVDFTVQVDPEIVKLGKDYIPDAAIVKVTFWSTDRQAWETITQQKDDLPGVRVDFGSEGFGSGSYPVWKYESGSNNPYLYRIEVTSFVYPDGTIVRAQKETENVVWTDEVYTATMNNNVGGLEIGQANGDFNDELYAKLDKTLDGAYYSDTTGKQAGTLHVDITMDLHDVTFDARGGQVNGQDKQLVENQYKIPNFKDYVPTRGGGYTFGGWYLDADCNKAAEEGADLTESITLYAKWIEPRTIRGTVTIAGTYDQNGETVSVHEIDKATEAVIVLQEIRNGVPVEVNSQPIEFGDYSETGSAVYEFTQLPNDGKEYQIHVMVLNYNTGYDNNQDKVFGDKEHGAVFGTGNEAVVDAHLDFAPPSYIQNMSVDATQIGETCRPEQVLAQVLYRDTGDNHPYHVISQHDVEPYGVEIGLPDGTGTGSQSIWNWHTDGTLYDYQMNITKVDGKDYDSDSAPYYITYSEANNALTPDVVLQAVLIPHKYPVTFVLNAGTDTVTGMEAYVVNPEDGYTDATHAYAEGHTWSYVTKFASPVPQREGYKFLGWQADGSGVTVDNKGNVTIKADVHEAVVLTAQWEQITYNVVTKADPDVGGTTTGDGTYNHGSDVTIVATPAAGYTFQGWYENHELVSGEASHTFEILANRNFTAKFSQDQYLVTTKASPADGGTTTGGGTYVYGDEITLSATAKPGYSFRGWYCDEKPVSEELTFKATVTGSCEYIARFEQIQHTVTTVASPTEGGTTDGDGTYAYGTQVTVNADAETGYVFTGWFENEKLVSKETAYTFSLESDRLLTAQFEKAVYKVVAEANHGGTAEGSADYYYGATATVKAIADATFTFGGWYEGTTLVSTEPEYSFVVTSDRTLTAEFVKNGYQVTVITTPGGTATGGGYYEEGEKATVTATPVDGHIFRGWFEDGVKVSGDASFSFTVTADRTLKAEFSKAYVITTVASPAGAGTLTGGGLYEPGSSATITAKPKSGYYFAGWYDENGVRLDGSDSYTEVNIGRDRTFTAKFMKKVAYKCDYVYIFGYEDTEIGAEGPLLRGELAQMIFRLAKQQKKHTAGNYTFADTEGQWYRTGISYMVKQGAISAGAKSVNPEAAVTCGETYKMICLGLEFTDDTTLDYSAYQDILTNSDFSADMGVTKTIKRWEFCRLFNEITGRENAKLVDAQNNAITADTYGYTDLKPTDRYYEIMLRATSAYDKNGFVDVANRAKRNPLDEYGG